MERRSSGIRRAIEEGTGKAKGGFSFGAWQREGFVTEGDELMQIDDWNTNGKKARYNANHSIPMERTEPSAAELPRIGM